MPKLKKRYEIPGLNPKAFQTNSTDKVKSKHPTLSTTQLEENLVKICRKSIPTLKKDIFSKHIGSKSTYNTKPNLIEALQAINGHFQSEAFAALTKDERCALVYKLTESIDQCTAGFHARVNVVLTSINKDRPSSLPELLSHVRKALVEQVAGKLNTTYEVHTDNSITIIAEKDGLGIAANLKKDMYHGSGLVSHEAIRMGLERKFKEAFTPSQLPFLLAETLRGFLVIDGYMGPKGEGESYDIGEKEAITAFIKRCLSFPCTTQPETTTEAQEEENYFIIDEDYCIRDLDWNKIHRDLLKALEKNGYLDLKEANPQSVIEHICHAELTSGTHKLTDDQFMRIVKLLDALLAKKDYYSLQIQLEAIQTRFPSYYTQLINTEKFVDFPRPLSPFFFLKSLDNPTLDIAPNAILEALKLIVEEKDLSTKRITYIAKLVLAEVPVQPVKGQKKVSRSLLSLASDYKPAMIETLLQFIDEHSNVIDVEKLRKAFQEKDYANRNILMRTIIQKHPDIFDTILSFAVKHSNIISAEMLNQLLREKDKVGGNVLIQAIASSEPKALAIILASLARHGENISDATLKNLLMARDGSGRNILMQAIKSSQPGTLEAILAFTIKHPEAVSITTLAGWFGESDDWGRKVLMQTIASSQPEALATFLAFTNEHPEVVSVTTLTHWLGESDDAGRNVLMQTIASSQPEALEAILAFTIKHPETISAEMLTSWFGERDVWGRNILMQAIESSQSGALATILASIDAYPEIISAETLTGWFGEKDAQGRNILMQAIESSRSGALETILAFTVANPEIISVTTLTGWFGEKNSMGMDVLTQALSSNQPGKIQTVLTLVAQNENIFNAFIDKHKENLMSKLLKENIFPLNALYSKEGWEENPEVANCINSLVQTMLQSYLEELQTKAEKQSRSHFKLSRFFRPNDSSVNMEIKFIGDLLSSLKDGNSLEDFKSNYVELSDGRFSKLVDFCTLLQEEAENAFMSFRL